jgi:hypothetical protein
VAHPSLGLFAGPTSEFPEDSAPVPLVMVVVAGTGQVKKDAAETGLSELSLHKNLLHFEIGLFNVLERV